MCSFGWCNTGAEIAITGVNKNCLAVILSYAREIGMIRFKGRNALMMKTRNFNIFNDFFFLIPVNVKWSKAHGSIHVYNGGFSKMKRVNLYKDCGGHINFNVFINC